MLSLTLVACTDLALYSVCSVISRTEYSKIVHMLQGVYKREVPLRVVSDRRRRSECERRKASQPSDKHEPLTSSVPTQQTPRERSTKWIY